MSQIDKSFCGSLSMPAAQRLLWPFCLFPLCSLASATFLRKFSRAPSSARLSCCARLPAHHPGKLCKLSGAFLICKIVLLRSSAGATSKKTAQALRRPLICKTVSLRSLRRRHIQKDCASSPAHPHLQNCLAALVCRHTKTCRPHLLLRKDATGNALAGRPFDL